MSTNSSRRRALEGGFCGWSAAQDEGARRLPASTHSCGSGGHALSSKGERGSGSQPAVQAHVQEEGSWQAC